MISLQSRFFNMHSLGWLYSVLQVKKKEFAMKEEEEKTKKKPNWALQVSTLSDNKVWISLYLSKALTIFGGVQIQRDLYDDKLPEKIFQPPELVVNCVSRQIGRGRRRRGSWCRGGMRKRFDEDMDYLFDCKTIICANRYVCISTSCKRREQVQYLSLFTSFKW